MAFQSVGIDSHCPDSRWRVVGASVQGLSHQTRGEPCQDAHAWKELTNGTLVVAVADGAGSASLAEVGSETAARVAVEHVLMCQNVGLPTEESEWRRLLTDILEATRDAVVTAAEERSIAPQQLATTLIVVVTTGDLTGVVQVGDGAVVVQKADGVLEAATLPQSGEYINETTFITSPGYLETTQYAMIREPITGLGVLSDGLQRLAMKMPDGHPHPAFFTPLLRFTAEALDLNEAEEQLQAFLQSDKITQRADDDLTLVLAVAPSRTLCKRMNSTGNYNSVATPILKLTIL